MMCRNMAYRYRHSPTSSDTDIPSSGPDQEFRKHNRAAQRGGECAKENRARAVVSGVARGRIWRRTKCPTGEAKPPSLAKGLARCARNWLLKLGIVAVNFPRRQKPCLSQVCELVRAVVLIKQRGEAPIWKGPKRHEA